MDKIKKTINEVIDQLCAIGMEERPNSDRFALGILAGKLQAVYDDLKEQSND